MFARVNQPEGCGAAVHSRSRLHSGREAQLRFLDFPIHVADAARTRRILDLASTISGLHFGGDSRRDRTAAGLQQLPLDVGLGEPEAVADGNGMRALRDADAHARLFLARARAVAAVIDNVTLARPAEARLGTEQRYSSRLQDRFDGRAAHRSPHLAARRT